MIKKVFGPLLDTYHAWKLQKGIAALKDRTKFSPEVLAVAQAFDATLQLTRRSNPAAPLHITVTRGELKAFVDYITKLHDTKLTFVQELKYSVTALLMKRHLAEEDIERLRGGKRIVVPEGSGNRNQRRLQRKALANRNRR